MKLLIASRNHDKVREIKAALALRSVEMIAACDLPGLPEVAEDSDTFHGNAVKKAVTLALASGLWTLADDSGLSVDALDGAPGVRSARFAGDNGDYKANNAMLLDRMRDQEIRSARFHCVIALSSPDGRAQIVEGVCEGRITREPRGSSGFGYDPLFVPNGHDKTFAEMSASAKNSVSHRGKALERAREEWGAVLSPATEDTWRCV